MGSVSSEKIKAEVENLEISWNEHSGSLAGRKVTTLQAPELIEVRRIQEQAKELFRLIEGIEQSGASDEQLIGLREAQKKIATLYQATTETLLSVGTDELLKKTSFIAALPIQEIEAMYEVCLGLKKDLEEAKGVLRNQATQSLLELEPLVSRALDAIKTVLVSKKEGQNSQALIGMTYAPKYLATGGEETRLTGYVRSGGELRRLEGMEPVYGPVNINSQTRILNEMVKALLLDMNAVLFTQDPSGTIMATFGGRTYNFSDIIAKANFNHLNLEFEDEQDKNRFLDRYHELQAKGVFKFAPLTKMDSGGDRLSATPEYFDGQDPDGLYKNLTLAEKEAINVYTGEANWFMIRFLRGNITGAVSAFKSQSTVPFPSSLSSDQIIDAVVKEGLLHSAVCIFGLNKLPDYIPPQRADGSLPQYLYRNERLSQDEVKQRNQLVAVGGASTVANLMSTSHTRAVYASENVYLLIINGKGKVIEKLSQFPDEQEVIMPPTQLQWLYHAEDSGTKIHFYIVRPITSPIETPVR